jgi:hypothetical protein
LKCGRHKQEPLEIRIDRDGEPSGYAENPAYWIFSLKIRHSYCHVWTV